ncbi:MAG: glycosyltransferase family 1 protein [Acidobacteriota bacterium]
MRIGIDGRKIADFGIGSYIRGLLGGLAGLDEEHEYLVLAPKDAAPLIPPGIEHVVLEVPHYSLREIISVGRMAERLRLDVFHAPHYVVPITRTPVVVTIHDLIHLKMHHRNPLASIYARVMLRRATRVSRIVLTVSEAVRHDISSLLGAEAEVTPNGIDAAFSPTAPRAVRRPYFFYAGNDKPHKNVGALLDAFAEVRRERPEIELVLAGAPFERYRNRDGVLCAGMVRREELVSLYRGALALVMPSLEEGFGMPAAEAMACGTAVITSVNAALEEVTGDAALHVDARDPAKLAAAMLLVAADDALRTALGTAGVERARDFTWSRCAALTLDAYVRAAR